MSMEKSLKTIILVGLFATLFTPLVVTNSLFFPFITGKAFFFRIIVEIIFAAWLLLVLKNRHYLPRPTTLLWALLALVGVVTLATIFSLDPARSFWSNFERMEGLLSYLHLLAYFLVLSAMLRSEKLWWWFLNTSIFVSLIVCLYSVVQLSGGAVIHQGGGRVDATLGNAIYLAVYLLIHLFLSALLWYRTKSRSARVFYILVLVLQAIILYYTATRGTILGLIFGLLVTLILLSVLAKNQPRLRRFSLGILLVLLILGGSFFLARDSQLVQRSPVLSRFANISLADGTVESRFGLWRMSFEGFKEQPLLGWGPENFNLVFAKYYQPQFWKQEPWFDRSHNIFFDWLTSAGLLGLLSYLSLFVVALIYLWRSGQRFSTLEQALLSGLLVAYFFHNIFVFDNLVSYLLFLIVLAYIQFRHLESTKTEVGLATIRTISWHWLLPMTILIIGLLGGSLYYFNLKPILANQALIKGRTGGTVGDRFNNFQRALAFRTLGLEEAREQLLGFAWQVIAEPQLADSTKSLVAQVTVTELAAAVEASPLDPRPALFVGGFLARLGRYDEALTYLKRAETLSPRKQHILLELVNVYKQKGDNEVALRWAKKAYDLDQRFDEARYVYVLQLIYSGHTAEANKLIKESDVLDTRFINAYADAGQIEKVLALWQEHIKREPKNSQYRFNIAATYLALGRRAEAIKELETALTLDPSTSQQAKDLIKEIKAGRNPLN